MKTKAAVAWKTGAPLTIEDVELQGPQAGEVLVEVKATCRAANQPLTLRRHARYDHGYYFISTFMADHIAFHADALNARQGEDTAMKASLHYR